MKTLGLIWNPRTDSFQFSFSKQIQGDVVTKRTILSAISSVFDPLGLIGPVIVIEKLLMQKLWIQQRGWDQEVPEPLRSEWLTLQTSLHLLTDLKIPRCLVSKEQIVCKFEIHGFSDASETAYGACVYLKSTDTSGNIKVILITSKSRVAPLRKISLPRLELCGALLLAELIKTTLAALHLQINSVTYYSNSTIVLTWIRAPSSHWTTFVVNRIYKIQKITSVDSWTYIKGENLQTSYQGGYYLSKL